jgi:hypothetical protein
MTPSKIIKENILLSRDRYFDKNTILEKKINFIQKELDFNVNDFIDVLYQRALHEENDKKASYKRLNKDIEYMNLIVDSMIKVDYM